MDRVLETMKESMFFLRSTQNLLKVFLSASALHAHHTVLHCLLGKENVLSLILSHFHLLMNERRGIY